MRAAVDLSQSPILWWSEARSASQACWPAATASPKLCACHQANPSLTCRRSHGHTQPLLERLLQLAQQAAQQRQRQARAVARQRGAHPSCLGAQRLHHLKEEKGGSSKAHALCEGHTTRSRGKQLPQGQVDPAQQGTADASGAKQRHRRLALGMAMTHSDPCPPGRKSRAARQQTVCRRHTPPKHAAAPAGARRSRAAQLRRRGQPLPACPPVGLPPRLQVKRPHHGHSERVATMQVKPQSGQQVSVHASAMQHCGRLAMLPQQRRHSRHSRGGTAATCMRTDAGPPQRAHPAAWRRLR